MKNNLPKPSEQCVAYVMATERKNLTTAILLSLFFGPYGMLYSTMIGAIVMFAVHFLLIVSFGFVGLLLSWPAGIAWAYVASDRSGKMKYKLPLKKSLPLFKEIITMNR